MPKIVVLHIITKLELGGAQQNTLYTVLHLNRERFDPYLISGKGGVLDNEASKLGSRLIFIPSLRRDIHPFFDLLALIELVRIIRKIRRSHPEALLIVHTHSSKAGILGRVAAYLAQVRLIIHTYHGFGFHDYQNKLLRRFYVGLERWIGKITRRIIFVSRNNASKAIELGIIKESPLLIRSGISFTSYQKEKLAGTDIRKELNLSSKVPLVTMVACFKEQKAPLDFIFTAREILKQAPDTHFLLVGDGELRSLIEGEIAKSGMNHAVTLLGWRRDVPEILASSDIFLLTSLWEGLPRVLIEARLSALPVVTTDIEGADEIVDEGRSGFVVRKKDYLALADKVLYLLKNPALAKKMGEAGSKVPIEYDIDEMVQRQEKVYLDLIEKERNR
jgi:glycosyltransferase involved in cell wall biosynthesis